MPRLGEERCRTVKLRNASIAFQCLFPSAVQLSMRNTQTQPRNASLTCSH